MAERNQPFDINTRELSEVKAPGLSPLQQEGLSTGSLSRSSHGIGTREMQDLQFQAIENTYKPTRLTGTALPFHGEGSQVSVMDPAYKGIFGFTERPKPADVSARAETVAITTRDGRTVSLDHDASVRTPEGRPLITSAKITEADGSAFDIKRLGTGNLWKDSRSGGFSEFHVESAVGTNPTSTAEIFIRNAENPKDNMFFSPESKTPQLTGNLSTEELLAKGRSADNLLAHYPSKLPSGWAEMEADFSKYAASKLGFSQLTTSKSEGLFERAEEIASHLGEHGGKIGLGLAAIGIAAAAGKYFFGSHEKIAPALSTSAHEPLGSLHFNHLSQPLFEGLQQTPSKASFRWLDQPSHRPLSEQIENSKALDKQ